MATPLELRNRVLVVQSIEDREVAWMKPFARIDNSYYHDLPEVEYSGFGTPYLGLVAIKGSEVVTGDTFETYNPHVTGANGLPIEPLIGKYIPGLERL